MDSFSQLKLETERLLLRPLKEADAEALYAIHSDPEVMRYWSSVPWTFIEQAHEVIDGDIKELALGLHLRLGMERKGDGALIGTCSLFNLSRQNRRAEIGYILSKDAWGRGFMQETLLKLVAFAFQDLSLHRLEADIDPRNISSRKSLERLGFVREGLLRGRWIVDGEVSDSELYGLLRSEWGCGDAT
jgi:RimJ/RimL family protein N-acetyltransferase